MPHLVVEYSENMAAQVEVHKLFPRLHQTLAETAGIDLHNCKSRALCHGDYWIGAGETQNAFLHLEVRILEGRTLEKKHEIGRACLAVLVEHVARYPAELAAQITVEIRDMQRQAYLKAEHSG